MQITEPTCGMGIYQSSSSWKKKKSQQHPQARQGPGPDQQSIDSQSSRFRQPTEPITSEPRSLTLLVDSSLLCSVLFPLPSVSGLLFFLIFPIPSPILFFFRGRQKKEKKEFPPFPLPSSLSPGRLLYSLYHTFPFSTRAVVDTLTWSGEAHEALRSNLRPPG